VGWQCLFFINFSFAEPTCASGTKDSDSTTHSSDCSNINQESFIVAGYLPRFIIPKYKNLYKDKWLEKLRTEGLTHLIVIGFTEATKTGGFELQDQRFSKEEVTAWMREIIDFTEKNNINLGISITGEDGGWMKGGGVAVAASDPEKRAGFARELISFCKKNNVKLVDFDWEFPATRAEERDYTLLLQEVKKHAQPEGIKVSVCVSGFIRKDTTQVDDDAVSAVDYVHLMAYIQSPEHKDMGMFEWMAENINYWLNQRNCPGSKLVVGIPFFSKSYDLSESRVTKTYEAIYKEYSSPQEAARVDGFLFNDYEMVEKKIRYVWENDLAGVMIWALGQDISSDEKDEYSLQNAIYTTVKELEKGKAGNSDQ
jgi:GH18 family chitinase